MKKEIANIFSKTEIKKEIPNKLAPIIIDSREKQSLVGAYLREKNAQIKFETLDIGDYLVGDTIIERKTFQDFQSSLINKRLLEQLSNLKKYPKALLIIEGFIYNYQDSRIHENALRGMMLSSILDFNIPIAYTENEKDTANYLIILAKRFEKPKIDLALRYKKSEMSFQETKQFILEGFPGIGPTTAKKLLDENKTLKKIFKLNKKELSKYLDEEKAKEFLKIIND